MSWDRLISYCASCHSRRQELTEKCRACDDYFAIIVFMKSRLGGLQMHYERAGEAATFACAINAPRSGSYALSARVVTITSDQVLLVFPKDASTPIVLKLPYTLGKWQRSEPVVISLVQGKNVLKFNRSPERRGLTIKEFTLTPHAP